MLISSTILGELDKILPGNKNTLLLALATLISKNHLLIEDIPGMGKTTFVKFLSRILQISYSRIQCTNDLMPPDILGFHLLDEQKNYLLKQGPIFTSLLLVDEINRASSRSQSAFLQAMEERAITLDGINYPLPHNFTLIATQNPQDLIGTSALPESQMDRFLIKMPMGRPTPLELINFLKNKVGSDFTATLDVNQLTEKSLLISVPESIDQWLSMIFLWAEQDSNVSSVSIRSLKKFRDFLQVYALLAGKQVVHGDEFVSLFPLVFGQRLFFGMDYTLDQERAKAKEWLSLQMNNIVV
jgi:MoxR-like ATPase